MVQWVPWKLSFGWPTLISMVKIVMSFYRSLLANRLRDYIKSTWLYPFGFQDSFFALEFNLTSALSSMQFGPEATLA